MTSSFITTNQSTHSDTPEALAVSNMSYGKGITSGYSREKHLLLTSPPQVAIQAGGTPVGPDATPRQAFAAAGCAFKVVDRPLAFDADPENIAESDWRCLPSHKAIVREDNGHALGVVSRTYQAIQNESLIQLFEYLREDAKLDNIIAIKGGKKIFATATVSISGEITEGNVVRRQLHAFNSFDGSTSFGIFWSDMVAVCANQIHFLTGRGARKAKSAGHGLVFRHTKQVKDFVHRLPQLIDLQNQTFQQDLAKLRPLTTTRLTTEAARQVLEAAYADKLAIPITDSETGEKRQRTVQDLERTDLALIRSHTFGETGIGIDPADRSVWNLFMGITQHETHDTGRGRDATEAARTRLESLWGGAASQRIERARQACLALV